MPASLHRSTDSSTSSSSSLPGLAPPPPFRPNFPDVSCKVAERNGPALVVPRFDLIGLPTFSWQNRVSASVRGPHPPSPGVWRRFRPARHPPSPSPSPPSSSSSSGRKTFARWRTIESPPRDLSASFQFSDVSSAPSAEIDVPPSLTDAGEEGAGSIASRKPAGDRSVPRFSQILRALSL